MARRLLYVEWDDHCSSSNRWESIDAFQKKNSGIRCRSVGWVIAESKDAITLAGTTDMVEPLECKADQVILKNCIRKKRRLKV